MEQSSVEFSNSCISDLLNTAKLSLIQLGAEIASGKNLSLEEAQGLRNLTELLATLRKQYIIALLKDGTSTTDVAKIFKVTPGRISQISGEAK